jgi:hypothetical protein
MVTNFCGIYANRYGTLVQITYGVLDEMLERISALGGLNEPQIIGEGKSAVRAYDTAAYKCAADTMVLDAGVRIRLHTLAVGAIVKADRIEAIVIESKSGRQALRGQIFVDCSGDADLAAWAGAPFAKGNEQGYLAFPTMMFRLGGVETSLAEAKGLPLLRQLMREAQERGEYQFVRHSPIMRPQAHPGEWRVNMTQVSRNGQAVDGTIAEDLTYAEVEGRRQVVMYAEFLRRYVPGFSQSYIQEIASQIGIRETRRIIGRYILTVEDILDALDFPDAIGLNGWPVEKHVLGTIEWRWIGGRGYCQLPYRALLPQGLTNLLVAGRCISATQDAQASTRVSGPCYVMGEAAGTAAALALRRQVAVTEMDIVALQTQLAKNGVALDDQSIVSSL